MFFCFVQLLLFGFDVLTIELDVCPSRCNEGKVPSDVRLHEREREGFCLSIFVVAFTHESLEDFTCCIVTEFVPFEV